jgi:small subunit ribosomal protein S20
MANIKSSIRRIKVTERNTLQNRKYLSNIKTYTKKYLLLLEKYITQPDELNLTLVVKHLNLVYSKIDKATKAQVLHKNTAARKKSALRNIFNLKKLK